VSRRGLKGRLEQQDIPALLPARSSGPAVNNTLYLIMEELQRQF